MHQLWRPGDRVAVAVSGGVDSVVLLHLLHQTRTLHRGVLSVVTVDHGTRPESATEAALVGVMAATLGLPCHTAVRALGAEASEALCRDARFEAFSALDCEAIALAHHADDQAATVLLQLMRGAGTRGMGGMRARRGRVVRPLLGVRKHEIRAWAENQKLSWSEDPTNHQARFLRNRVRAELLPLMEEMRPGAVDALARGAGLAAEDDRFLDELAAALPQTKQAGWDASWVGGSSSAMVGRVLRQRFPALTAAHLQCLQELARNGQGRLQLAGGEVVEVEAGRVHLYEKGAGRLGRGG